MFRPASLSALSLAAFALSLAVAAPALAEAQKRGEFTDWSVYTRSVSGDTICYALTQPVSKVPGSVDHGDVYFMVANWKSGAAAEQPSLLAGYPLKLASPPEARVGSTRVDMYASENEAFVEAGSEERKLVSAMRRGAVMRVEAVSERGTATAYEFSLKGVTAALRRAKALCG